MHALLIKSGKHAGKKLSLPANKEIIVGRDDDCQIRLATSDVSRRHCSIQLTADGLSIKDLGSRNGTIVNGNLITDTTEAKVGDTIELGPMLFEVVGPNAESKATPQPTDSAAPTEDSIADWLADDAQDVDSSGSTTTIISTESPEYAAIESAAAAQKRFKSVAEEGADIIRRHLEKTGQQKNSSD